MQILPLVYIVLQSIFHLSQSSPKSSKPISFTKACKKLFMRSSSSKFSKSIYISPTVICETIKFIYENNKINIKFKLNNPNIERPTLTLKFLMLRNFPILKLNDIFKFKFLICALLKKKNWKLFKTHKFKYYYSHLLCITITGQI